MRREIIIFVVKNEQCERLVRQYKIRRRGLSTAKNVTPTPAVNRLRAENSEQESSAITAGTSPPLLMPARSGGDQVANGSRERERTRARIENAGSARGLGHRDRATACPACPLSWCCWRPSENKQASKITFPAFLHPLLRSPSASAEPFPPPPPDPSALKPRRELVLSRRPNLELQLWKRPVKTRSFSSRDFLPLRSSRLLRGRVSAGSVGWSFSRNFSTVLAPGEAAICRVPPLTRAGIPSSTLRAPPGGVGICSLQMLCFAV